MTNKTISNSIRFSELWLLTKLDIGFGFLLLLYIFFYLDIYLSVWWPTLFILPFLLGIILAALLGASFSFFLFRIKELSWKAVIPILINGLTLLGAIYLFYPVRYLRINIEFLVKNHGFEQIITMVNSGDLRPDQFGQADLPKEYQYLSGDDKVRIYKEDEVQYLYFDTNAAIIFPKASYVYRSDGLPPDADIREKVYKINFYWYLISYL